MNVRPVAVLLLPLCAFAACNGGSPAVLQSTDGKYRLVHVADAADAAAARTAMAKALAEHDRIDAVFAHDAALASAAEATCREKGRTGVRFVDVAALRLPVAEAAIDVALLASSGITPPRQLHVGTLVVTKATAAAGGERIAAPADFVLANLRREHAEILTTQPKIDVVFRIGLAIADDSDAWRTRLRDALVAAAKRYPQVALDRRPSVQECAADTYNVILVVPPLAGAAEACKAAMAQGKRVVVVDRELGSDDFTYFVGIDGNSIGAAAHRQIADLLGAAGGSIVEISGPASSQSEAQHAGFVKALGLVQKQ